MYRKILTLFMAVLLLTFVGCKKDDTSSDETKTSAPTESESQEIYTNPLTGVADISEEKIKDKPVAIMINNVSVAQPVQAGVPQADIIYETEVEGGITRLMAVYQDISKVEKIGTVRSARYVYVDLAMGHDAIYVHHGQDPNYAAPHLKDTQAFTLGTNNAGYREKNGLASEHTLYGYGEKIWKTLVDKGYNTKNTKATPWQTFADKDTAIKYESVAKNVTVPFSTSYKSVFKYNAENGKYQRFFKTTERKDYYTGESEYFKNVFILSTTINDYPDGKHRNIDLTSGSGYYCVNGTYTPIKWSKGNSSSSFVFTTEDGKPLTVNQGNSWVCIMGKKFAPTFE